MTPCVDLAKIERAVAQVESDVITLINSACRWGKSMTERTQLSYLDLAAFYKSAADCYAAFSSMKSHHRCADVGSTCATVRDLASKLQCVIAALRADGLDARWNPEADAVKGLVVTNSNADPCFVYELTLDDVGAKTLIDGLHKRGYKIVKDAT